MGFLGLTWGSKEAHFSIVDELVDCLALCQLLILVFFLTFRGHNVVVRTLICEKLVLLEILESVEYLYGKRERFRGDSKD